MKQLVVIIVKYLKRELEQNRLNPDAAEGVEVAVQCLENAYGISPEDVDGCTVSMEDLYIAASCVAEDGRTVTDDQREEAEHLKNMGNKFMREGRYVDAISHYTSAIELNPRSSVFFCNRAAAHIQYNNYLRAINDCHEAIRLDPSYSKAHSRLGYAYQAVGERVKARDCYAKAVALEPENESYRNCYEKLSDQGPSNPRSVGDLMGILPGIDLSSIMKNPSFVQMASQMLEDPGMQNAVTRILSGQSTFPMGQVEELITAGQQLADRLQSRNDTQQDGGSSSGNQPSDASRSEGLMGSQDPAMEGEPSSSAALQPPRATSSVSAQSSVGVGGDGPSSSSVQDKDVHGPYDVEMENGGDNEKK